MKNSSFIQQEHEKNFVGDVSKVMKFVCKPPLSNDKILKESDEVALLAISLVPFYFYTFIRSL